MSKLADFENASLKNAFNEMKDTVEKHPDYEKYPEIGKMIEGLGMFTEGLMVLNSMAKTRKEMKNLCGKMIPIKDLDKAYEVWESEDGTWKWYCLKKNQGDDDKIYASWFCAVKSPFTYGGYDYGDTYVADIKANAKRIK